MSEEHEVTAMPEKHRFGDKDVMRYRGRCSCSHQTFMHYATPEAAQTALRRTHLKEVAAT